LDFPDAWATNELLPTLEARCWLAILPFRQHTYSAGPTTTMPYPRGPQPHRGLKVILRMPSLTVLMEDAVSTVAFDSAKFGPGSSLIPGCLAEELLHVERDKLRRARSELIALLSPAGLEYEVPLRTLCHEYLVEACRMTLRIVSSPLSLPNYGNSQPMSSRNQLSTYKYVWTCETLGKWSKIRVTF
jgi:hypothetical protein